MYKATRTLIQARQKYSADIVMHIPNVRKIGGGIANDCYNNSYAVYERGEGLMVSGWLVDRYNAAGKYTEITQHWWNACANGQHFDTTPNIGDKFEYVADSAICAYGQQYLDFIDSCVCSSLVLKSDGTYLAINHVAGKLVAKPIADVSNESLFAHQFKLAVAA